MEDRATTKVKVINTLTGEITDVLINNVEEAKNLYVELAASATALGKAKDQLRNYLDDFLGEDEKYEFADGKVLRRIQRTSKVYRVESLKKYLDEDQIEVCLKVDTKVADQLIGEMQERGELPPDTLKNIREEADSKSTAPFVELR